MTRFELKGLIIYRERHFGWSVIWFLTSLVPFLLAHWSYGRGLTDAMLFWLIVGGGTLFLSMVLLRKLTLVVNPEKETVKIVVVRSMRRRVWRLACGEIRYVHLTERRQERVVTKEMTRYSSSYFRWTDRIYRIELETNKGEKILVQRDGASESPDLALKLTEDLGARLRESMA